jgi:hypothetical protein
VNANREEHEIQYLTYYKLWDLEIKYLSGRRDCYDPAEEIQEIGDYEIS